ncbi:MAG: nucleotidyltransferase family protein, partial [Candidatus Sumerlaeota bacterium]
MTATIPQQPDDATRTRVVRLCGLLARPHINASQQGALRDLVTAPGWQPIPRLASWHLLEPLFVHHLKRVFGSEYDEAKFFLPSGQMQPAPQGPDLVMAYYHRASILDCVLKAIAAAGIKKVMLIKGVALAPLYEAPATRQMCDADFVVSS